MKEYYRDDVLIARHITNEDLKEGLSFFSKDEEFIQVGSWVYPGGKKLAAHVHNKVPRTFTHTQEVVYIKKGSIKTTLYDLSDVPFEEVIMKEGEIMVLLNGGHGYDILEDGTQVLEIKNGPYVGAEADRRRI